MNQPVEQQPVRRKPSMMEVFTDPRFRTVTVMTGILGFIAVIQFITGIDESVYAAALIKPFVRHGQWWRLLTCAFLHGGFMHIIFNGLALYKIGKLLEFLTNRGSVLVVYFIAILSGSIFSMIFMPNDTSLGASGGIIGLFGFLAVLAYKRRSIMPPGFLKSIINNLVFIAVIGVMAHNYIDNASHAGGLLAGVIVGWMLIPKFGRLPIQPTRNIVIAGNLLFALFIITAVFTLSMIGFVHYVN